MATSGGESADAALRLRTALRAVDLSTRGRHKRMRAARIAVARSCRQNDITTLKNKTNRSCETSGSIRAPRCTLAYRRRKICNRASMQNLYTVRL